MRNSRKRRQRELVTNGLMLGMSIMLLAVIIWLIYTLSVLITKTVEYDKAESGKGTEDVVKAETETDSVLELETEAGASEFGTNDIMNKLEWFAKQNGFLLSEYPEELIELLQKNPETEEFVLNYPLKKNEFSREQLTECLNQEEVPLLMQWDSRWGYYPYGNHVMGLSGCGPTCLSMVAVHLLQNPQLTPAYIADYSERNGYYISGAGTSWELMSRGAANLGLTVQEVPLDEGRVYRYLQNGKPIICSMGPGDFTETGHFIVFIGLEDGKIKVNDPNSKANSEKLWEFEKIKYQIKNMWVYGA